MNMRLVLGRNFEPPTITAIDPDCNIRSVQLCFAAFREGGDGFYKNWWDFQYDVRRGHIIPAVMQWRERDQVHAAQLGVELMKDDDGPYIQLLYYNGDFTPTAAPFLAAWLHQILAHYKVSFGLSADDEAWCLVKGRPGWRRVIRRLGLAQDEAGYISDQQGVIFNGLFRRQ